MFPFFIRILKSIRIITKFAKKDFCGQSSYVLKLPYIAAVSEGQGSGHIIVRWETFFMPLGSKYADI